MTDRLANKTALITGAAQGIGLASAVLFAKEGAKVIATDRNSQQLDKLAGTSSVETVVLDVTDDEAVRAMAESLGTIDILFNCAGVVHSGSILECSDEDWDSAFAVNTQSMFRIIRAMLPAMLQNSTGSIINMASVASSVAGVSNRFAYSASKAAVVGMTKSIAADFVAQGIRCNAICPGTVDTPSLADRISTADDPVAARQSFLDRQPMGRLGNAEEIAALALYLAADESAFTTGTIHIIDGGWTN